MNKELYLLVETKARQVAAYHLLLEDLLYVGSRCSKHKHRILNCIIQCQCYSLTVLHCIYVYNAGVSYHLERFVGGLCLI